MNWCKIVVSVVFFTEIWAWKFDFSREIQIACVSNESDTEFSVYDVKYDQEMAKRTYKFHRGEILKIKELIGNRDKIIFFFLGHEDHLYSFSGQSFRTAKAQMLNSQACVCTVSYAYLNGPELLKYSQYFAALEHRIPRVVEMAASLIKNIVDSIELKVTLSNVFLSGFCLGGHVAGMVGYDLRWIYNDKKVRAVWAFDPPSIGFSVKKGIPRRVQKGDADFVAVFHTSQIGVKKLLADCDIMVNSGQLQPGCQFEVSGTACSHFAGFILREKIATNSDDLEKRNKLPFAYNKNEIWNIKMTEPPIGKRGIYYMRTGMVFDTKTEGIFERISKIFSTSD